MSQHAPELPTLPTLAADAEALREHGHRLVDQMADYLASVEGLAVSTPRTPSELRTRSKGTGNLRSSALAKEREELQLRMNAAAQEGLRIIQKQKDA